MTLKSLWGLPCFMLLFTACDKASSSPTEKIGATAPQAITLAEKSFNQHRDFSLTYWTDKLTSPKPSFMMESNYFQAQVSTKSLSIDSLRWRDGSVKRDATPQKSLGNASIPFKIHQEINQQSYQLIGFQDNKHI